MFQKYGEKVIDIFGLNRNMPYFCIRFPRDGKPEIDILTETA